MVNPASCQFANYRSVRFNLDSFALPVVVKKKKNSIYTSEIVGLQGTKTQLKSVDEVQPTYGFSHVARWGHCIFAADNTRGVYYASDSNMTFRPLDEVVFPRQLAVVGNRLFAVSSTQERIVYSVDLRNEWSSGHFFEGFIYLPASYGSCLDIRYYQEKLLVICEKGLLTINQNLKLSHLDDDSSLLQSKSYLTSNYWESGWFSLGYATDTQTLREVFLKANANLTLTITSNRTQRTILVKAADHVQKIKLNLNGDQFKVGLSLSGHQVVVSDLAAVISYGKRG